MKVARWYGAKDVRVEETNEAEVKDNTVKIKVAWCGICGSDLHEYMHGPLAISDSLEHPLTGKKAPIILGHEFSGEIVEIGNHVTKVGVGDHVTVEPIIRCGNCAACKIGHYNICENRGFYGLNENGGFAEYAVIHEKNVHKLPKNMTFEEGAVVEPTAVAFHAVRQSRLKLGDTCIVFGAGPIGLLIIQACKVAGASKIIAVELSEERLDIASTMGATHTINPAKEDMLIKTQEISSGGVDVCFEAAGVLETLENAIQSVKVNGQVVIVSVWDHPVNFNPNLLFRKECKIQPAMGYRHIFPEIISLIADKKITVDPIITNKIQLDNIVHQGFEKLTNDKSQTKILVQPSNK